MWKNSKPKESQHNLKTLVLLFNYLNELNLCARFLFDAEEGKNNASFTRKIVFKFFPFFIMDATEKMKL